MADLVADISAQDTKERAEKLTSERGFAIGRLDELGAVCGIPLHQSGEVAAPSLNIVLHARRLLLSRYQSAGRTLRICAIATCASSSSRSSFDVDTIILASTDRNEADWLEGTAASLVRRCRLKIRRDAQTADSVSRTVLPSKSLSSSAN